MKNQIKILTTSLVTLGSMSVIGQVNASEVLKPGEDRVFGASGSHMRLGKSDPSDRAITVVTRDPAGENELASMLSKLSAAGLIGGLVVRMEVPNVSRLSSTANDAMLDGDHKTAFDCYGILVALEENNNTARFELSKYLIQGIRGSLEPKEADRMRASQLLIEASWLEMTQSPDEPDHAGRLLRSYEPEVYDALSKLSGEDKPFNDEIKERLQAQLFSKIKDLPTDPF